MSNLSAKPQGRQRRDASGYEKRDASAAWIFGIVAFLIIAGLIMHFVLAGVMERFEKRPFPADQYRGTRRSGETIAHRGSVPRLQLKPPEDLNNFRAGEETALHTYAWIDRTTGVVRIPIDRAMDLVLERGLPTRSETNKSATGPSNYELQQQRPQSPQPEIKEAP
jgi:hypothetical protein